LIYIAAVDACYYPDLTIVCGPPVFQDDRQLLRTNPMTIFEVLSPSTASFDRGTKLKHYQLIPSLQDYLIVSPDEPYIEHHERDAASGLWQPREISGIESEILIRSCDCRLSLAELYG
jgi:Uma2 family endonuclease